MNNYVYIVASLPEIAVNYEGTSFDYAAVKEQIVELLSEDDQKLVGLLEEGFDEETLGAEFYAKAAESKNRFIREYFDFDGRLRNMKVAYLAKRLNKQGEQYLVDMPEADFEEESQIKEILENADFVLREQKMDELKWEKASDIARMDYFNMNAILAFLVKAKTVQRWAELDKAKGEEMFRKLVKEVRGTFEGIK
ncbi:MAG: DUF2764 family protein [Bacteroidales bacterium]|nr:DUF2764 family protein [Bacteroidales bacterium]MBO7529894.1 DUF2764 family protein [Bacteroidales bacterium]